MERTIGGYLEWELQNIDNMPNSNGILLNTGRNALEYILRSLLPKIKKLFIPYFTCDTVLEPLNRLNISYEFYSINANLELCNNFKFKECEYLLYTNYFGIKDEYVFKLYKHYSSQLIVDNAQALYCPPIPKCVYSPRKFVGIPDGGIAFTEKKLPYEFEIDISYDRCEHLLKRIDLDASEGYINFRTNSLKLKNQPIKQMSKLTRALICSTDFVMINNKRKQNFEILHQELGKSNNLIIPNINSFVCPLVYPYFTNDNTLKKKLIDNKIFVATYWPNVLNWCKENTLEYHLTNNIIAIPIDQRYGKEDMEYIIQIIKNLQTRIYGTEN